MAIKKREVIHILQDSYPNFDISSRLLVMIDRYRFVLFALNLIQVESNQYLLQVGFRKLCNTVAICTTGERFGFWNYTRKINNLPFVL